MPAGSRRKLLVTLLSPLAAVVVGELALRIARPARGVDAPIVVWNALEDRELDGGTGLHRFAGRQLWEPRPGAPVPWSEGETINAGGYRGPLLDRSRDPGVMRIALVGESATFGMCVPWKSTFGAQLERELERRGVRSEVLDAGVIGHTVEQGIERYEALVSDHRPDVVVIAFGAYNEHLPAIDREDREKIEDHARWTGFWPRLYSRIHSSSRLVQWASTLETFASERESTAMRSIAGRFGGAGWRGKRRVSPQRFEEALERLVALARDDGARVVLLAMARDPAKESESPVLHEYDEIVHDVGAGAGVDVLDLRARTLALLSAKVPWKDLMVDAFHPAPAGHRMIALGLADLLLPVSSDRALPCDLRR